MIEAPASLDRPTSALAPARSRSLRVPAVAGILGIILFCSAFTLFARISAALNTSTLEHGLAELTANSHIALLCQQMFAVADIAFIIFLFGVASLARPTLRALAWLGCFIWSVSFLLDLLVVASIVSVTTVIVPHLADPAFRAAGIASLGFAATIDSREGFLWLTGSLLIAIAAWRGRHFPRWLAALLLLNGVLSLPSLPYILSVLLANIVFAVWVVGMCIILWRADPVSPQTAK